MGFRLENKSRPLRIRFEICNDNEDFDFRSELVLLMISSIQELRLAAMTVLQDRNVDLWRRAVHKSKSTLVLLNDSEFYQEIERYKEGLAGIDSEVTRIASRKTLQAIQQMGEAIVNSLHQECLSLKARARTRNLN